MQAVRVAAAAGLRLRRLPPASAAAMAAAMTSSFVPATARPAAALPSSLPSTSPSPSPSAFASRVRIQHARLPRPSAPERRGAQRWFSASGNVASCPSRLNPNAHQLCFRRPAVASASAAAAGGSETAVHGGAATAEAGAIHNSSNSSSSSSSSSSGSPDDNGHATPVAPPADASAQNGSADAGAGAAAPAKEEKGGKSGGGKGGKGKGGSGGGSKGGKGKAGADAAATSSSSKEAIRALRIQKVEELRKAEQNPYAYGFARSHRAAQLQRDYAQLQDGEEAGSGVQVRVAGRVVAKRVMGKLAFLTLRDEDTTVQLFCMSARMEDAQAGSFAALKSSVDVGDIVGAVGGVKRTERGELSVVPTQVSILTKSLLPLPDKWHGLTDVETRYRQRYLDMIVNPEVAGVFRARAKIVSVIRRHMEDLGFVEVETPVLQADAGGAEARPFITHHNALGQDMYLRIATELHLKRMIVGGFDRVFEMGRIFRNEGISTRHNPEFTSIEMYQAYADYTDMMDLVEALVEESALALHGTTTVAYQGTDINLARPWRRASMDGLVKEATGVDFMALRDTNASLEQVRAAAETALEATLANDRKALAGAKRKIAGAPSWGHMLNEVFEAAVEKSLVQPTLVMDHPVDISPLAKPHRSRPGLTERFELFVCGRELANAFSELTDPLDQRARLEEQVKVHELKRAAAAAHKQDGNPSGPDGGEVDDDEDYDVRVDEDFVTALEYGMPPTAGMGIGVDRLVMLLTDSPSIRDVIAFPVLRQQQQQDHKVPEDKHSEQ